MKDFSIDPEDWEWIVTLDFYGESFSPSKLESITEVKLVRAKEVGDIGETGRYREKPLPYGAGHLESRSRFAVDLESPLIQFLKKYGDRLHEVGCESVTLTIGYFCTNAQCNSEFSAEVLSLLGKYNVSVCVSIYTKEGFDVVKEIQES